MPTIIIKGTQIEFPSSGAAPNWAPAVIEAVEALADAVNSVHRLTQNSGPLDGQELVEAGTIEISYNGSRPVTQKWELVRAYQGGALIDFTITDLGQIQFTTTALTGINHIGTISYRALAIMNT